MSELSRTDIYKVAIEISNQLHFRTYDRKNIPLFDAQVVSHLFFEIKVERKSADDFSLFSLISTATGTGKPKGKGMASLASTAASKEPPGAWLVLHIKVLVWKLVQKPDWTGHERWN